MERREPTQRAVPALLVLAVVAFAVVRVPYVSIPLERDEGEYAYIAQRMLAGEPPYRDAFDQKPPAVFAVYAGAFAALGETVEAIHLTLYLWTLAAGAALFALMRRLTDPLAAAFGVLVFAVVSADARIAATAANTEMFMLLPMVLSTLCLTRALATDGRGGWLACGAFAGLACWFKPVAATHLCFVAVVAGVAPGRRGRPGSGVRALGLVVAGAAAASLPIVAALAAAGVFGAFVDGVIVHNLAYAGSVGADAGLSRLAFALGRQAPGFAAVWLLAAFALVAPPPAGRRARALLGGWLVACLAGASVGLYFRPHYFVQALPPLAALCGIGLAGVARSFSGWVAPGIAVSGAAALALAPPLLANRATLLAGSPTAASRIIYGLNPFPESARIAAHLRATSDEDDRVLIVGSEPQILFYAGRRSATVISPPKSSRMRSGGRRPPIACRFLRSAASRAIAAGAASHRASIGTRPIATSTEATIGNRIASASTPNRARVTV